MRKVRRSPGHRHLKFFCFRFSKDCGLSNACEMVNTIVHIPRRIVVSYPGQLPSHGRTICKHYPFWKFVESFTP